MTSSSVGFALAGLLLVATTAAAQGAKPLRKCPADAVVSGTVCMDTYEASAWRVPDPLGANKNLVKKIQQGKATAEQLAEGGATLLGTAGDDYGTCGDLGAGCTDVYAVSLPAVLPSAYLTFFQAQQACKNARKRLPTNAEWQAAVAGTPGPGADNGTTDCNTQTAFELLPTGSRSGCVSADGVFDMVGNLYEFVAEWVPRSIGCSTWSVGTSPLAQLQCLVDAASTGEPGVLARGGHWGYDYSLGAYAGPLSIAANTPPTVAGVVVGFRCAR